MSSIIEEVVTDACPSPPRGDPEEVTNVDPEVEDFTEKPRVSDPSPTRQKSKPKPKPTNTYANVINISNSNGIQIGSTYTFNLGNKEKPTENIMKTDKIMQLFESRIPVEREHIMYVATHIGSNWKGVGKHLNYSDGQIEQFYEDNKEIGVKEAVFQLLLDWTRNDPDQAFLGRLAKVLWESGNRDPVRRLSKKIFV
ncbi:PREDICTED: uncharacterized protein LOC108567606 [Nicrophorus vespilloides]|uniref:Uncharacterized protein LOC108567606 n=1 Tax=Nicrophorus vespilloides TaxID=110193 RepID=A0ABM1NA23_NICVS|nr:PREDICTED: uncharacterized protein LOC108567606 [Nicrophorus vespilloides]